VHRDRAEPAGKAHSRSDRHLRYRTPNPSEVVHREITSLVTMRWPIVTGSSMGIGAFQNHDELVRTSLYKRDSHWTVIELKGPAVDHVGTVRAALPSRTDLESSARHDHSRSPANANLLWVVAGSALLGVGLAIAWSPSFVDQTIGENGATTILGYDVTATPIGGVLMAIGFAFISGLTGTFTACNVAGLSAIAPLSAGRQPSFASALRSLGWLALGTSLVAGLYGAIGALVGPSIPQLSQALIGRFPIRLIQSSVVFGILGLLLLVMGLASLRAPTLTLPRQRGREISGLLLIGGLIGAFLIGRPFALFVKIFQYAAATHNPGLGALVFVLQSLGNIAVLGLVFVAIATVGRGRLLRWLASRPDRLARFNAIALLAAGTFLIAYWCMRLPAVFGIGWWPRVPWS
jgi:MFS family permease